jgi:hypothetical protein
LVEKALDTQLGKLGGRRRWRITIATKKTNTKGGYRGSNCRKCE